MKRMLGVMLALSFLVTTVGVTFAQDTKTESTGKKKGHKKSKKKESTDKKGGSL